MTLTPDERKTLEFEYEEVCRSHAAITDFRGKLLALLPLASGAGLFLLLEQRDSDAPLLAIGVFGCAVTLGLFIYELRNVQECDELICQGGRIEDALEVPKGELDRGLRRLVAAGALHPRPSRQVRQVKEKGVLNAGGTCS